MSDATMRGADTWEGPRSEGPGAEIGPYRIVRKLGEGGFGAVFEAEQSEPIKRRVALKIIKLGMDSDEVIARFEAERQALALMDHPHIAGVLDAGTTVSGRLYFVMELVDGEPISAYCDAHQLSIEQRLALFDQVCTAVQHAHTKGIIHRDLKPNNVLVSTQDGQPYAKVIDFGIAKATSGRLTDRTLQTELNQIMGTPLYMSPEQAEGNADIDTRTDIYSLGVMLYELLTGSTPVQSASLRSAVFAEIQRIICEVDPPRPSARLSETATTLSGVATQRATDPRKLTRMVRGELDWIVMKAIEKERGRRYETANDLAMDLRRHLAAEPVLAAPPSASYRMRKFVRRHKGAVAAGGLIAASLLIGIVGFAWQARIAQQRADQLAQVAKFQADMLAQINTTTAGDRLSADVRTQLGSALEKAGLPKSERDLQMAAFADQWQRVNATDVASDVIDLSILKPAVMVISKRFRDQPAVDANLRQSLADTYRVMGLYGAALPLQQTALTERRKTLGEDHADTLASIDATGQLLQDQGKLGEAQIYYQEALKKRDRIFGKDSRSTMASAGNLGTVLMAQGKFDEAEPYLRDTLARSRRVLGADDPDTLNSIASMGNLLEQQGKLPEAETYDRDVLARRRRINGETDANTLLALNNLGVILQKEGKSDEAEPYLREVLQKDRHEYGENHEATLLALDNLGMFLQSQGKLEEAEPLLREALSKDRIVLGNRHVHTIFSINNLGMLLLAKGEPDQAGPLLREALVSSRAALGNDRAETVQMLINVGNFLLTQGRPAEADPLFREALSTSRRVLGDEHPDTLISVRFVAASMVAKGRFAEAEQLLAPFEPATRATFTGSNARRVGAFLMVLGEARSGQGKFAAAEPALLEAQPILLATRGPQHPETRECTQAIIDLYSARNAKEPGRGYDAKSSEWKVKLKELDTPASAAG